MKDHSSDIQDMMWAGIRAVQPAQLLPDNLQLTDSSLVIAGNEVALAHNGKLIVLAIGKAAAAMAHEAEKILGDSIDAGLCITKYDHAMPLDHVELIEAAHPVPDENSIQAGDKVMKMVNGLTKEDIVILLISGGASSLMADLPENCSLRQLQDCFELLVNSGAGIREINVVRKHLSQLKGGQLAKKSHPASIYTLIISDVVGDDISSIASGPTAPDASSFADAKAILEKYDCWNKLASPIREYLENGSEGKVDETAKPGDPVFEKVQNYIIASNEMALEAARQKSKELGYHTSILKKNITGDTVNTATEFVEYLIAYKGPLPACFIMGGETSLKVSGDGKGGRNQHFVLSAARFLSSHSLADKRYIILSAGTDGTDGPTDATGAFVDSELLVAGKFDQHELDKAFDDFNSYPFFEQMGLLIKTGPTQTNVMDLVIGLVIEK